MKFVCDKCSTKYSIADDRVRGRVLKIRCKSCNHVITVREEHSGAARLPSGSHSSPVENAIESSSGASQEKDDGDDHTMVGSMGDMPGMSGAAAGGGSVLDLDPALDDEWYVSFDGDQEGPYPLAKAVERIRAEKPRGKEVHCWRPGFFVWLPIDEVPEFARALKPAGKPQAAVKPAVPAIPAKPAQSGKPGSATGSRAAIRRDPTPPTVRREATNPSANKQAVAKDPTGPRAALAVAQAASPQMPPVDSKPMPLPPPPDVAPHFAQNDPPSLGAPIARADSAPKAPAQSQVTRPEPRLYRKPSESASAPQASASLGAKGTDAAPAKKPAFPSLPQDVKKPVVPSLAKPQAAASVGAASQHRTEEASPFAAALAASAHRNAPGSDTKIPDTGPTPLPPPPGEELPIGEASGLLNLSHLAGATAAASQRGTPHRSVETFGGATVTPSGGINGMAAPPPVVVVAGPAPRHTAPYIKWLALIGVFLSVGLGGALIYVVTRTPAPVQPKTEVAEPSRKVEDKPIAIADPANPQAAAVNDPKRPQVKHPPVAPKGPVAAKPVAAADPNKGLTEEQKRLRALYGESDSSTPHSLPAVNAPSHKGPQVNEGALSAVVSQNKNSMGLCYQRVLKHDPTLKSAKMIARVKIGISGRVTNVSFGEQPGQQAEISQCLTQSIKRWAFPANDSEYDFEFPIVLQAN